MNKLVIIECHAEAANSIAKELNQIGYCSRIEDSCHDPIVELNRKRLLERSNIGVFKYGVTIADNPLTLRQWLNHALEEALDMANYLQKAIQDIDNGNEARKGE